MPKSHPISVQFDDRECAVIEAEQERLRDQGLRVSKSAAIRSLIMRGSTVTNIPNGNPKSMTSEKFELTG